MNRIEQYGWNETWQKKTESTGIPGRIVLAHKQLYRVMTNHGEWLCSLSGKFKHVKEPGEFPAVGDWVMMDKMPGEEKGIIHEVLPRASQFSRISAGETSESQLIAVNMDYAFLVMSLNHDFNLRRLERYLLAAWDSGANPVIVLTKKDQCEDPSSYLSALESIAFGVPVFSVSSFTGDGIADLLGLLSPGKTGVLLGSSGVGKSSLINALMGTEKMAVQDIRSDDSKGRHTTTHREMILLPSGGLLIDTPGMREFQVGDFSSGAEISFSDIEDVASKCKFRNCSHNNEPGCAIREALETGGIQQDRYASYLKLMKEMAYMERKTNEAARLAEKARWKNVSKELRKKPAKHK